MKKTLTTLAAALAIGIVGTTAVQAADPAPKGKTVQEMRQPIPLSLERVNKVLGQPGVYILDCNPEEIHAKSHIKGSIHANIEDWTKLLPADKKNSFIIFYCINRVVRSEPRRDRHGLRKRLRHARRHPGLGDARLRLRRHRPEGSGPLHEQEVRGATA